MRDAEGRQRLALKRVGGKTGAEMITTHISMSPDTHARVEAIMIATKSRSFSRTVGHILRDALVDDAITDAEARVILRGLKGLADLDADDSTMDIIEQLTEKLERAFGTRSAA